MTAMRLHRYPSPSGGIALGKMGVGATMIKIFPYDAEVEYLESTGTQWIDTGVIYSPSSKYYFEFVSFFISSPSQCFFGWDAGGTYGWITTNNTGWSDGSSGNRIFAPYDTTSLHRITIQQGTSAQTVSSIDGYPSVSRSHASLATYAGQNPYPLFALRSQSYLLKYSVCVGIFKIYIDDILVRDFIPVRFTNELGQSEGAMYNRLGVGGMNPDGSARDDGLYRNRGTGNFIIGPDINAPAI